MDGRSEPEEPKSISSKAVEQTTVHVSVRPGKSMSRMTMTR